MGRNRGWGRGAGEGSGASGRYLVNIHAGNRASSGSVSGVRERKAGWRYKRELSARGQHFRRPGERARGGREAGQRKETRAGPWGPPVCRRRSGSHGEVGSKLARGPQGQVQKVCGGSGGDPLTQTLLVREEDEAWALPVGFRGVITKTSMRASLMAEVRWG